MDYLVKVQHDDGISIFGLYAFDVVGQSEAGQRVVVHSKT